MVDMPKRLSAQSLPKICGLWRSSSSWRRGLTWEQSALKQFETVRNHMGKQLQFEAAVSPWKEMKHRWSILSMSFTVPESDRILLESWWRYVWLYSLSIIWIQVWHRACCACCTCCSWRSLVLFGLSHAWEVQQSSPRHPKVCPLHFLQFASAKRPPRPKQPKCDDSANPPSGQKLKSQKFQRTGHWSNPLSLKCAASWQLFN